MGSYILFSGSRQRLYFFQVEKTPRGIFEVGRSYYIAYNETN